MKAPIEKCPHCGHDEYYIKNRVYGTACFYSKFNGDEADNSALHDYLIYKDGKYAYCGNCHKRLFKMEDM